VAFRRGGSFTKAFTAKFVDSTLEAAASQDGRSTQVQRFHKSRMDGLQQDLADSLNEAQGMISGLEKRERSRREQKKRDLESAALAIQCWWRALIAKHTKLYLLINVSLANIQRRWMRSSLSLESKTARKARNVVLGRAAATIQRMCRSSRMRVLVNVLFKRRRLLKRIVLSNFDKRRKGPAALKISRAFQTVFLRIQRRKAADTIQRGYKQGRDHKAMAAAAKQVWEQKRAAERLLVFETEQTARLRLEKQRKPRGPNVPRFMLETVSGGRRKNNAPEILPDDAANQMIGQTASIWKQRRTTRRQHRPTVAGAAEGSNTAFSHLPPQTRRAFSSMVEVASHFSVSDSPIFNEAQKRAAARRLLEESPFTAEAQLRAARRLEEQKQKEISEAKKKTDRMAEMQALDEGRRAQAKAAARRRTMKLKQDEVAESLIAEEEKQLQQEQVQERMRQAQEIRELQAKQRKRALTAAATLRSKEEEDAKRASAEAAIKRKNRNDWLEEQRHTRQTQVVVQVERQVNQAGHDPRPPSGAKPQPHKQRHRVQIAEEQEQPEAEAEAPEIETKTETLRERLQKMKMANPS
jgi:hypothetical protein